MECFYDPPVAFFTGHRELTDSIPLIKEYTLRAVRILHSHGVKIFYAGGAIGFDMLAEECVIEYKAEHPDVMLKIALPFGDSDSRWSEALKTRQSKILSSADEVLTLSESYSNYAYLKRDRFMADASAVCVAYLKNPTGGTAYTVDYAKKKSVQIINLADVIKNKEPK